MSNRALDPANRYRLEVQNPDTGEWEARAYYPSAGRGERMARGLTFVGHPARLIDTTQEGETA